MTWKRATAPVALAMDASLLGAGACELGWEPQDIWKEKRELPPLKEMGVCRQTMNRPWFRVEHINILEMRALVMSLLPRINQMNHFGMRWKLFSDSCVVVGAEIKLNTKANWRFTAGLAPSTIQAYASAIAKFKARVGSMRFDDLDGQLLDYVQSFPPLSQRSAIERLGCAFRHFFPEITHALPRLNRFAHQLRRQYRGLSKPPMIWDVVVLVVFQLAAMGFPITALGTLLQFDCFLRPMELAGIRGKHIAFLGGRLLGSQAKNVLVLLPRAKTGPLQSVRVGSSLVIKLLSKAVKKNPPDVVLFPSVSVYRQRLAKALYALGLDHIGYTPHSIRHGAATMALINKGEDALPAIMFRGRWESSAGKS